MAEKRILKRDYYSLRGMHALGGCVEQLVVGTVFELKEDEEKGETTLHAYGREYWLDARSLFDILERSEPYSGS